MGVILPVTGFFVPSCEPFFITRAYAQSTNSRTTTEAKEDTAKTRKPRYSVRRTSTETTDDVKHRSTDLQNPDNLKTDVTYDETSGTYHVGTTMVKTDGKTSAKKKAATSSASTSSKSNSGDNKNATNVKLGSFLPANDKGFDLGTATSYLSPSLVMSFDEYMKWSLSQSMAQYYRQRNQELFANYGKDKFDFTDMRFSLGPAEKIFGPGGVQIKTQGSAELKIGGNMKSTDNPTLAASRRSSFGLDFDLKMNLTVNAKVGDKVNMNLNYNSDATFDYDAQNLKLKYDGKEDEIIKLVEAGNVSMPSNMSLVPGVSSLFGLRTDVQFGKLKLQTVFGQKKSASKSVSGKGGANTTSYELSVTDYEENRHFYLAHHFRDTYDKNMRTLPTIASGVTIKRIEVWVTNKTGTTTNTRNIIALTDLGEPQNIRGPWQGTGGTVPHNRANNEYTSLVEKPAVRDISQAGNVLEAEYGLQGSFDYDKLQSARLLSSSEYHLNAALGTLTLNTTLQPDDILAVAYEYTYGAQTYQVGEFSSDLTSTDQALMLKMLKGSTNSPSLPTWRLMMRNVYSLGTNSLQNEKFRLDIKYQSDSSGVYLNYLPEDTLKGTILLRAMNLDRLDANNKPQPNGQFDFVDGYTVHKGRIIFPVAEPFGEHLRQWIEARGGKQMADKYVFQELYDTTKTAAKQMAEKNKFLLTGQYKGSAANEIDLGAYNIAPGSVVVTAGGVTLVENTDYIVDYNNGTVTIINQSIIDAGTPINASVESNDTYGMQRKTFVGLNADYQVNKNLTIGGTFQYLSEQPMTTKVSMGNEALNNILWGAHLSWKHKAQWLTNWIDAIPFVEATQPSQISFDAQVAQLVAGQSNTVQGGASYLDDFEDTKRKTSLIQPTYWQMASVPSPSRNTKLIGRFTESRLTGDVAYGYNRALLAWYCIDPIFTNRSSTLTPSHIKSDLNQLSNHYIRAIYELELYPNKSQTSYNSNSTLNVLNMAFYPQERGPYNLTTEVDALGNLLRPETRWGGMMRKMDNTDFEAQNIEYIEFWLMDPFFYEKKNGTTKKKLGGDLYFNLGEISEDILKDGKKAYESGLPIDGNMDYVEQTVWGYVPKTNSITYAFNNEAGSREKQDLGLNGLNDEQEKTFGPYMTFWNELNAGSLASLPDTVRQQLLADPANDNYHYFRGSDYDRDKVSVLTRYKRINMPQGNSPDSQNSPENYETAWKNTPDIEDINSDYTLGESEKYWQYHLPITPENLRPGGKYVSDTRTATVTLRNGEIENIDWYLIRIPLHDSDKESVGGITDFSNIRFMRMFMTNFTDEVILRFGTLDLVHGDWRTYENTLYAGNVASSANTDFTITAVNIEENNDRVPVNYVVPPGISRVTDAASGTLMESNEQALALTVKNLGPNDARAVYKNVKYDMRKYRHLQLFAHANQLEPSDADATPLQSGQVSVFLRLGSDYRNNYYEYEIPLELTPIRSSGKYSNNSYDDRVAVWPEGNMFDFDLDMLVDLKRQRNKNGVSYNQLYTGYDPDKPSNRIAVIGNPSLGEVKTIMIGVRNHADANKSVEVWVNELRLQEFTNEGGWAAQGNLNIQLSDIASVSATGKMVTAGFGGIEQTVSERSDKDDYQYQITTSGDAGRLLPEKARVSVPIYYSYNRHIVKPKYNPLDTDMLLSEALDATQSKSERDSIVSLTSQSDMSSNFSISGAKVNIASKKHPMPYDPANFSFSYAKTRSESRGETTVYEYNESWKASMVYAWSPNWKNWEPFSKWKTKSKWAQIIKDQNIAFAPQSLTFNTDLGRTYYELQERDLENIGNSQALPVTWSSTYLWNRNFSLRWDIFKALHFSFQSATNAEVEQPNVVVNKDLYPDEYQAWKDSVNLSLAGFGRPLDYSQSATMSYKLPINKIPIFDWITADGSYNTQYSWKRGAELENGSSLGHTINTQRSINANGKLALETLYNKSPFLKEVNKVFSASNVKSEANKKKNEKKREKEREQREKEKMEQARIKAEEEAKKTGESVDSIMARTMSKGTQSNAKGTSAQKKRSGYGAGFARELQLIPDSAMTLTHNQKSKRLIVRIQDAKGHDYKIKYKKLDDNKIQLFASPSDSVKVRVNVIAKPKLSEEKWYKWVQAGARFAMMLRNVSVSYRNTYNLSMSGFVPEVGDIFGQRMTSSNGFAPGVDFGFGFVSDDYINDAKNRGWLLCADSISTPATSSTTEDLQIKASLEPFTDMKIDLNMSRTANRSKSIQFMYDGSPTTQTGSFNMTIVSLSSAFAGNGNAGNGYYSSTFENFRAMLPVYQQRVEQQYIGGKDPMGRTYLGSNGDPSKGNVTAVNRYGADVMIPAFLAAYTGGGTTRELNIFPSLSRMLPNWSLTYKGLSSLPFIRDYFKSVTVTHGYKSVYAVGSYNSYASWKEFMHGTDLGFTVSQTTGAYTPSSCYDISSVSINESFAPLLGLNFTFHNNMTLKAEYRTTRVLTLSVTSAQLTQTGSQDFVLGWGYKINDFRLGSIFGSKRASQKALRSTAKKNALKARNTGSDGRENIKSKSNGFAHALSLRFDFSIRNQDAIRRDIQTGLSEATSGNKAIKASFRADYTMSKYVTMTLYYDRQRSQPLLSSSAYPTVTQDFGLSMKFALTR